MGCLGERPVLGRDAGLWACDVDLCSGSVIWWRMVWVRDTVQQWWLGPVPDHKERSGWSERLLGAHRLAPSRPAGDR